MRTNELMYYYNSVFAVALLLTLLTINYHLFRNDRINMCAHDLLMNKIRIILLFFK